MENDANENAHETHFRFESTVSFGHSKGVHGNVRVFNTQKALLNAWMNAEPMKADTGKNPQFDVESITYHCRKCDSYIATR